VHARTGMMYDGNYAVRVIINRSILGHRRGPNNKPDFSRVGTIRLDKAYVPEWKRCGRLSGARSVVDAPASDGWSSRDNRRVAV
jgi:hypothetical protein